MPLPGVDLLAVQSNTPEAVRGRVSGLWQVQALTGTAVGAVGAEVLDHWFSPESALDAYGSIGLLAVVVLAVAVVVGRWLRPPRRTVIDPPAAEDRSPLTVKD